MEDLLRPAFLNEFHGRDEIRIFGEQDGNIEGIIEGGLDHVCQQGGINALFYRPAKFVLTIRTLGNHLTARLMVALRS